MEQKILFIMSIELFKAINEEELALQYAQIEKTTKYFGKKNQQKSSKWGVMILVQCGSR